MSARAEDDTAAPADAPPPADLGLDLAARPRSPLAGPTGHPYHPMVASVAVAALVGVLAFDLGSFLADEAWAYTRTAYVLAGVGVGTGIAASVLGLLDLLAVPRGTHAFRAGVRHLVAMDLTLVLFAVSFLLRRQSDFAEADAVGLAPFLFAAFGLGALVTGVWLGHRLAYGHGVRVATGGQRRAGFGPAP